MEPGLIAASERRALDAVHARYAPVNDRVAAILENIRCDCRQLASETRNRGNERQVEEFIARLSAEVGNRAYEVSRRAGREPVGPEDARRWDSACRLGVRYRVLPVTALRDLGCEPHHRHAGRGGRDRARHPALPYDAAYSHLETTVTGTRTGRTI